MKKILSLMGSIGILATSGVSSTSVVVSCNDSLVSADEAFILGAGIEVAGYSIDDKNNPIPDSNKMMYKNSFQAFALSFLTGIPIEKIPTNNPASSLDGFLKDVLKLPDDTKKTLIDGINLFWQAAAKYMGDAKKITNLLDLANQYIYRNSVFIKYFVMKCKAKTVNFDTDYAKRLNKSLETFKYQVFDKSDKPLSDKFSIICRTESDTTNMGVILRGEKDDKNVEDAQYIRVYDGDKTTDIILHADTSENK